MFDVKKTAPNGLPASGPRARTWMRPSKEAWIVRRGILANAAKPQTAHKSVEGKKRKEFSSEPPHAS